MSGQRHSGERHPDTAALAEYRAGLTSGLRGKRLAAHVASCASCASVSDQLAAVSSALAAAPAPPLPDAVERRITAALATEAALSAETSLSAEPAVTTEASPMA
jgi:anti-sigma factor ChrR (cupin superfamily)